MTTETAKDTERLWATPAAALPLVAVVGQPNVGKSTLFNRLIGQRRSIVGDEPGITRDRIYGEVEWAGKQFSIVDTGGIIPDDDAVIPANIFKQAGFAIDDAQAIIWVVDARLGLTPLDEELATLLRATGKRVLVAANKSEKARVEAEAGEVYRFGFEEVFPGSAEPGVGLCELLGAFVKSLARADVAIVIIDAEEGPIALDAHIAGYAHDAGCSIIIACNKWDALKNKETSTSAQFERKVREKMKFLEWAPVIMISALNGQRVENLLELAARANVERNRRIPTSQLNAVFETAGLPAPAGSGPPPGPSRAFIASP